MDADEPVDHDDLGGDEHDEHDDERYPLPREELALDEAHTAETLGHVSVWFDGGRTDVVELVVGTMDGDMVVGRVNTRNDINSSMSTIIRPGETWMARTQKGHTGGFRCVFTPFGDDLTDA